MRRLISNDPDSPQQWISYYSCSMSQVGPGREARLGGEIYIGRSAGSKLPSEAENWEETIEAYMKITSGKTMNWFAAAQQNRRIFNRWASHLSS
jgi:hypothetical protein